VVSFSACSETWPDRWRWGFWWADFILSPSGDCLRAVFSWRRAFDPGSGSDCSCRIPAVCPLPSSIGEEDIGYHPFIRSPSYLEWICFFPFRELPFSGEGRGGTFGVPFAGVIDYGKDHSGCLRESEREGLSGCIPGGLFLSLLLAIREVIRSKDEISVSFLVFLTLPQIFMTTSIWVEPWSYGRVIFAGGGLADREFYPFPRPDLSGTDWGPSDPVRGYSLVGRYSVEKVPKSA